MTYAFGRQNIAGGRATKVCARRRPSGSGTVAVVVSIRIMGSLLNEVVRRAAFIPYPQQVLVLNHNADGLLAGRGKQSVHVHKQSLIGPLPVFLNDTDMVYSRSHSVANFPICNRAMLTSLSRTKRYEPYHHAIET